MSVDHTEMSGEPTPGEMLDVALENEVSVAQNLSLQGGEDSNSFPAMPHEPPICSPMNGLGIPQHHLQPYRDTLQPSPGHESPSMHQHQLQGHKLAPGALLGQPKPVQPQVHPRVSQGD